MIAVVFLGIQLFSCSSLFLFKAFLYMIEVVFLGIQLFSCLPHVHNGQGLILTFHWLAEAAAYTPQISLENHICK